MGGLLCCCRALLHRGFCCAFELKPCCNTLSSLLAGRNAHLLQGMITEYMCGCTCCCTYQKKSSCSSGVISPLSAVKSWHDASLASAFSWSMYTGGDKGGVLLMFSPAQWNTFQNCKAGETEAKCCANDRVPACRSLATLTVAVNQDQHPGGGNEQKSPSHFVWDYTYDSIRG